MSNGDTGRDEKLSKITSALLASVSKTPDKKTKEEIKASLYHENEKQNIVLRRKYAIVTGIGVIIWYVIVLLIVVLTGAKCLNLSDAILITLITTSTVNLLGVLTIIVKYLFNSFDTKD